MMPKLVADHPVTTSADVTQEALAWPDRARQLAVIDGVTYVRAGELLMGIKDLRDRIAETFDPHIKRAHEIHKGLLKEKQDAEAPLIDAERVLKASIVTYATEQERLRQAEARRLQDEARRQEEARRLEEAAAMEREAIATGDLGLQAEAERLIDEPIDPMPVCVPRATPKVSGMSHRESWSARVTSLAALVKYVAAHPEHQNLLQPNTTALNALARSMKSQLKIDGVRAINTPIVAAGPR